MQAQTSRFLKKVARFLSEISKDKRKLLFLLLLLSPGLWQPVLHPVDIITEVLRSPNYLKEHVVSIFSSENLKYIEELRGETWEVYNNDFVGRTFYNKLTLLVGEFFEYTSYLSPHLYFFTLDELPFSPQGVEAIPVVLFPFWALGSLLLIGRREFKPILALALFGFLAFLFGKKISVFLFPALVANIYIAADGVLSLLKSNTRMAFVAGILVYGVFLLGRFLWQGI